MPDIKVGDRVFIVGGTVASDFGEYMRIYFLDLANAFATDAVNKVSFIVECVDPERKIVHLQAPRSEESAKQVGVPGFWQHVPLRYVALKPTTLESAADMEALYG